MSIYTISDLHLSFGKNKPMDIFGDNWENHAKKIEKDWKQKVAEEDVVILGGDFCWGISLEESLEEFQFLESLPRKKASIKRKSRLLVDYCNKNEEIFRAK